MTSYDNTRKGLLATFTAWCAQHIKGDEKGESQIFLDRLFQAFGHKGIKEAGAELEMRVKKSEEGGTAFADLVWKPIVLIEMKKRGADLARHYRQAFDYWIRLVPGRPRYVVLCNFDEFWVYDFENQLDAPVDKLPLTELPNRFGPLAFLFPTHERPTFENNRETVTREAADHLALVFKKLVLRKVDRSLSQRFILQMLVSLFSEDIGLLKEYFVTQLLEDCKSPKDSYDLLGGLFAAMNTPGGIRGGRYQGVDYFNGGLFAEPARIELQADELSQLKQAAKSNWSQVSPEIFGTIFQHSVDTEERHAFGAHFTSAVDIMKIVGPTIVEPWRALIEQAKSVKRLEELHHRLATFSVLDPACGSGNFLYMAYREMRRLEKRMFDRMLELGGPGEQRRLGFVTAAQFHGIDIIPLAIELAKVTMMIGRKLAIDELKMEEQPLPLDNLDANFQTADALIGSAGLPTPWPKADVIIGNPPFLGAKHLKPAHGSEYIDSIRKAFPEVPGLADYCVYWIRRTQEHLPDCTKENPVAGRAGLVGTQNIRNNKSRVGGLDYVVERGTIIEAVDNQPWSGEANVHVSIVDWVKHPPLQKNLTARERRKAEDELLIPKQRKLWFKVEPLPGVKKLRPKGSGPANKEYELSVRGCADINSALSDSIDLSTAARLQCNVEPQKIFRGLEPGNLGFLLTNSESHDLLQKDPGSQDVVNPYLTGRELLTGDGTPERWLIDFQRRSVLDSMKFSGAYKHVEKTVLPQMQRIDRKQTGGDPTDEFDQRIKKRELVSRIDTWWQLRRCVPDTVKAVSNSPRYIVCSLVTKRPIFVFMSRGIMPSNLLQSFAFPDDYSFGILQSNTHWQWFVAKCSKLKSDFRYTPESVFDTFPWPQAPSVKQIDAVAEAGREVRRVRANSLKSIKGGLRAVYRTLELPGDNPLKDAHAALDATVLAAYGFDPAGDLLAQLLELNQSVAARIDAGEPVTAPGVPAIYKNPQQLISTDCIQPPDV
jgi:hypothetical protein